MDVIITNKRSEGGGGGVEIGCNGNSTRQTQYVCFVFPHFNSKEVLLFVVSFTEFL